MSAVKVTLLYFDGCEGWLVARDRLLVAAERVGLAPETVEYHEVKTLSDAHRWGFAGSPTILVDGIDPFAPDEALVGLACRVYQGGAGGEQAPTVEQLVSAFTAAARQA
jgi:hypothetical protein